MPMGSPRRIGPPGSPQHPCRTVWGEPRTARPGKQAQLSAAEGRGPARGLRTATDAADRHRVSGGLPQDLDRDLGDLGGGAPDAHALGLERLGLRRGGALRAGDDRARVAHRLARRRREAGDVADDGLGDVLADELGGLLLGRAADLAAHDDQLGPVVGLEELDDVDERAPRHRVASDADDRGVAEAPLGQLVADLVGQRARARDDADVALLEEGGRDDPDVRLARRQHAWAVRADQPDGRAVGLEEVVDAQLVVGWDALGDADHRLDTGVGGLEDRVGGERRRDEDHRRVRARLADGVVERVEDRDALDVLAALAGGDAGDDVRPVVLVVERVEGALTAGDAGDAQLRVVVDEDGHQPASSTTFFAAPSMVASVYTFGRSASASSARPSLSFVPSRRTTNGTVGLICANASIRPFATSSQRVMPPKMLNSTAVTFLLERIPSTACVIASALDPPPASRKFAGEPPAWSTTSSVDITSPAPLPRMPTLPSSLTNVSPRSLAICSCGSSAPTLRSAATSGWRWSALPSTVTLASSATTWRSLVTSSGLTSTSIASSRMKVS